MKNLEEFKKLIERYETITLDEIETVWKDKVDTYGIADTLTYIVANKLTGFGASSTCTLCQSVKTNIIHCADCVYGILLGCINDETYHKIENAKTPRGLLSAFKNRAKHLRKTYKEIL
jgi:hypothetical protein